MYKRVDGSQEVEITGFSYSNKHGHVEVVKVNHGCTYVAVQEGDKEVFIYDEDIPKLIKALQEAHNLKTKEQHE